MTPGCYFPHPVNSSCHDLTEDRSLPPAAKKVLGLGGKFIITPPHTTARCLILEKLERLGRDVSLKVFFAGEECPTLNGSKLFLKSPWMPPPPPLNIDSRLNDFYRELTGLFIKKKAKSNISKFEQGLVDSLRSDDNRIIASADKGLGPVLVSLPRYIKDGLVHLQNAETYQIIPEDQGWREIVDLRWEIYNWTLKHTKALPKEVKAYIRKKLEMAMVDPYGYFYLLYKLHKDPVSTRPVCSDCASLPHALGQWVDETLQPIVQAQDTYVKDSYSFKTEISKLTLPPNASIFTYDAISMYTKIDTEDCISRISSFLKDPTTRQKFSHYPTTALIEAIQIVMTNNRMRFGDILVKQLRGIAMGMSPAPTIANLYVAIYEESTILQFLDTFILWLRRFIDDGFGIWLHDADPAVDAANWETFKAAINGGGLKWTFSKRCKKVVFLDMIVEVVDGKLETALFHKPLALHLYLPPHSCHAPGVLYGLICGMVLRIHSLCSRAKDIDKELVFFFRCLVDRGHQSATMIPLFSKAIINAKKYLSQDPAFRERKKQEKLEAANRRVFLHLPYHPQNPPARVVQDMWRRLVSAPALKTPLNHIENHNGHKIPIDQMVIAYSRPPNLSNMLSYRKIDKLSGRKVSSYL